MKPNILITSSGAKVLLVRSFLEAANRYDTRVLTSDIQSKCASSIVSDEHLTLLPLNVPSAKEQLLDLISTHDVGLIVPTRDGELEFMTQLAEKLPADETRILCCTAGTLKQVQDKGLYSDQVEALGYKAIPRIDPAEDSIEFPVFTRPIRGAAGAGAYRINADGEMPPKDSWGGRLFHPFISAREYSIDMLMGIKPGQVLQCVVRERVDVRGGEAKISKIVSMPDLEREASHIASAIGLVGHNVMQAFFTDEGDIYHIETNPRFGGASNLSIKAGLDSPARLLAMHFEDQSDAAQRPRRIQIGATMYRYSEDFIEV